MVAVSPRGYLATVGAPALRFEEPAALPAPALPATTPAEPLSVPPGPAHSPPSAVTPVVPAGNDEPPNADPKPDKKPAAKTKDSPLIIPDDTRPAVHPEDFLPFFQFPAASKEGGLNVIVPVPREPAAGAPLPPSSATYTQTPK